MEINEVNKKLYESAFVSDGTFGDLDNWKPDIDERLIEESCEDENGNWVPATPLGYRDYKLSREEGIRNIIYNADAARTFTYEDAHHIKRTDNIIKKYDKITIDGTGYVVTGDDEYNYYIVNEEDQRYYISYEVGVDSVSHTVVDEDSNKEITIIEE